MCSNAIEVLKQLKRTLRVKMSKYITRSRLFRRKAEDPWRQNMRILTVKTDSVHHSIHQTASQKQHLQGNEMTLFVNF